MKNSISLQLVVAGLYCLALGCTARFSPKKVRSEIVRKRGVMNIDVGESGS